jgi:hypothetical protein
MKYAMSRQAITFAIQGAVLLAMGAAFVFTARSAEIAATAAATWVRNVDEPARNPYQQTLTENCGSTCAALEFAQVPANRTLRITNINCSMVSNQQTEVTLSNGDFTTITYQTFSPVEVGSGEGYFVNEATNLYSSADEIPIVQAVTQTGAGAIGTLQCTLSGYYVKV